MMASEVSRLLRAAVVAGPHRVAAETSLVNFIGGPEPSLILQTLVYVISDAAPCCDSVDLAARQLGATLLRRALSDLWPRLGDDARHAFLLQVSTALHTIPNAALLGQFVYVAHAAAVTFGGLWPELSAWLRSSSDATATSSSRAACVRLTASLLGDFGYFAAEAVSLFVNALESGDSLIQISGLAALAELSSRVLGVEAATLFYMGPVVGIAKLLEQKPSVHTAVGEACFDALFQIAQCDETLLIDPRHKQTSDQLPPLVRLTLSMAAARPDMHSAALRFLSQTARSHGRLLVTQAQDPNRMSATRVLRALLTLAVERIREGSCELRSECDVLSHMMFSLPHRLILPSMSRWATRAFASADVGDSAARVVALEALSATCPTRHLRMYSGRFCRFLLAGLRDPSEEVAAAAARFYCSVSHFVNMDARVGPTQLRDEILQLLLMRLAGESSSKSPSQEMKVAGRKALCELLGRSRMRVRPDEVGTSLLRLLLSDLTWARKSEVFQPTVSVVLQCLERAAPVVAFPMDCGPEIGVWLTNSDSETRSVAMAALAALADSAPVGTELPQWLSEAAVMSLSDLRLPYDKRRFEEAPPMRLLAVCLSRSRSPESFADVFDVSLARISILAENCCDAGDEQQLADALAGLESLLAAGSSQIGSWHVDFHIRVLRMLATLVAKPSGESIATPTPGTNTLPLTSGAAIRCASAKCCGRLATSPHSSAILRLLAERLRLEEDIETVCVLCHTCVVIIVQQHPGDAHFVEAVESVHASLNFLVSGCGSAPFKTDCARRCQGATSDSDASPTTSTSLSDDPGADSVLGGSTVAFAGDLDARAEEMTLLLRGCSPDAAKGLQRLAPRLRAAFGALAGALAGCG